MESRYSVEFIDNEKHDGTIYYKIRVTENSANGTQNWTLSKRYSEFRDLHEILQVKYHGEVPPFPAKKLFGNTDPEFIRVRQQQLQEYMNNILLLEPDAKTKTLQRFLEIDRRTKRVVEQQPRGQGETGARPDAREELAAIVADGFLDLAQSPASLDMQDAASRMAKYRQAIEQNILNQPVDPIHVEELRMKHTTQGFYPEWAEVWKDGDLDRIAKSGRIDPSLVIAAWPEPNEAFHSEKHR